MHNSAILRASAILGGGPRRFPFAFAFRSPALTRSTISQMVLHRPIETTAFTRHASASCPHCLIDFHGEQDPSLLDFKLKEYRKASKMVVAEASDRRRWRKPGMRNLLRKSRLSQKAVYAILEGEPVGRSTLVNYTRAVDGLMESRALVWFNSDSFKATDRKSR